MYFIKIHIVHKNQRYCCKFKYMEPLQRVAFCKLLSNYLNLLTEDDIKAKL